jgi:hypothetical protein
MYITYYVFIQMWVFVDLLSINITNLSRNDGLCEMRNKYILLR